GGYSTEPFKVDDITAQVEMQMINGKDLLVLRRWNGTDSLPEVRLGEPPWNSCGVVVCGDRRNVLGVWQVPEKKDPFLYHLNIFSTATGEKTAEVNATSWPSTAQLCGNYLVGYFPNRVFAINITTGKEVWSQLIKDLMYHGPYPPSAAPGRPITKPEETE
ncbi:MAG TPA: hypothetical protein VJ873_08350, partial [bacterium]|nr:hypothetical protein [bacterium]